MQFEYLAELGKEYKKFTGFMVNDQLRFPSSEAVALLSSEDICLPIDDPSSPIISAFIEILKSPKGLKTSPKLVSTMCTVANSEIIQGNALNEILKVIENNAEKMEMESGIKIIQMSTNLAKSHIFELKIFQRILSLVLSLSTNANEYVVTNSQAAFEQILLTFIDVIETQNDELNAMIKMDINEAFHSSVQYKETAPITEKEKYIYVIINDLLKISKSKQSTWITRHGFSSKMAYSILEAIFVQHSHFFVSHSSLLLLVSRAFEESSSNSIPLSFIINLCSTFIESLPTECSNLFSFHLSQLKQSHQETLYSLKFFRGFILKDQSNIVRFYQNVDKDGQLITDLIHNLNALFEERSDHIQTLHVGFSQTSESLINTTPIDITCFIIKSLFKTSSNDLVDIILKIWSDTLSILTIALPLADQSSSYLILQSLHFLIVLASELKLDDPRGSAISTVVNIAAEDKTYTEQLRSTAVDTISAAIEGSPQVFNDHWSRIINALSLYKTELSDLSFSLQLALDNIVELELALIYVKTSSSGDTRQWAIDFCTALLFVNKDRFNDIWPRISSLFYDGRADTADSLLNLMNEVLSVETESTICPSIYECMSDKNLPEECRESFISSMYVIISERSTSVKNSWPYIIKSLSPLNFRSPLLVEKAFRCLQLLCSDMLFYLTEESQVIAFSLIFDFVKQDADINIALSSLTLLWNAVSNAKSPETWKHILSNTADVISDKRPDISLAAVKTLFSLIISNAVTLTEEVFNYMTVLFPQILDKIVESDAATQQLMIYETAHCIHTLLPNFTNVDEKYWEKILSSSERFMTTCRKKDSVCQGFAFYEEFFAVKMPEEMHMKCFDSFDRLANLYIERESPNCVIFGNFGRAMRNIMPTQKDASNEEMMRWISLSHTLIFGLRCRDFLPPTVHKTFDAIDLLLPNRDDVTITLIKHLVECAAFVENERLTEVSIEHLSLICESKITESQLPMVFDICQPLFSLQHASCLLLHFIDRDIDIHGCDVELFARSLIEIAKSESSISQRACDNVLKILKFTSIETKSLFLEAVKAKLATLTEIWRRFVDPRSSEYDSDTAKQIGLDLIKNIGCALSQCSEEEEIIKTLSFIASTKIDDSFKKSHVMLMMPYLADLVLHPSTNIRLKIREVLLCLVDEQK